MRTTNHLSMPPANSFSLNGKVVIQFGSTGVLGSALLSALSAAGAHVIAATRNAAIFEQGAKRGSNTRAAVEIAEVDITDEASVVGLRDHAIRRHGKIDGVVFNVVSRPMRAMSDPISAWRSSMESNATGSFIVLRAMCETMATQGFGSVVNIASIQGMVGSSPALYEGTAMAPPPDYFFHKAGLINLTRYLASQYGAQGVRVNVVSPGGIFDVDKPVPEVFRERYSKMTMLGRMAEPSEVGGAVIFLLSNASSYITGVNLPVEGGYTAK